MGLQRVHHDDRSTEFFGPVRLGPQDLRDIAAIFADLDAESDLTLPQFKTAFHVLQHETDDVEDVLSYTDADTVPSVLIISGELRLTLHATRTDTTISAPVASRTDADQRALDRATGRLRQIIQARELTGLEALRQTGPDKGALLALLLAPIAVSLAAVALLGQWLSAAAANAAAWGVLFLCYVPLLALGRSRDLIRLRGQDLPWWERRIGLVTLLGVVLAVTVPVAIYALDGLRGPGSG